MKAVEVTIENLHALDVIIIPNLKHLGQIHTTIGAFKVCYLRVVEQAFDEVWARIIGGEDISVPGFSDQYPICVPKAVSACAGDFGGLKWARAS